MCSMSRDPRREEYTICNALAPEAVFTVRTYGDTSAPYDRDLVHRFAHNEPGTRWSARRPYPQPMIVSQVRFEHTRSSRSGCPRA